MRERDKAKALALIDAALETASDETIKAILCAAIGHPPVVHGCFGELSCARCGAVVGDSFMGRPAGKGRAIVGHKCPDYEKAWADTTPEQRLLTPNPLKAKP